MISRVGGPDSSDSARRRPGSTGWFPRLVGSPNIQFITTIHSSHVCVPIVRVILSVVEFVGHVLALEAGRAGCHGFQGPLVLAGPDVGCHRVGS